MELIKKYVSKNIDFGITKKAHVEHNNKYYVVSDNGKETLIFPSNKEGEVVSYLEVGGSVGSSLQYVLNNFTSQLFKGERYGE